MAAMRLAMDDGADFLQEGLERMHEAAVEGARSQIATALGCAERTGHRASGASLSERNHLNNYPGSHPMILDISSPNY
jgi:hypothetical protein